MEKWIIKVIPEKCTGCRLCELACSLSNEGQCNPEKSRIRLIRSEEDGLIYTVPVVCMQCEKAVCLEMCPTQALYRDPKTDAVLVDPEKCIGCRTCVYVCPFGGPFVDPEKHVSVKCTLCDGDPQCVKICPKGALEYVKADKLGVSVKRQGTKKYLHSLHSGMA